ncbi:ubiquitin-conjugating enzyme/RWD-like protein [Trametes punicea]|nr:ubiquitin-conjugating enzyme/RWD-like protein [Trametes punicea]
MASRAGLNKNNSAVKRIMQEARELANDPCTDYAAAPLEDDIFEWHCTIRGPSGTEFEGGLYHFRILLPSEYPFRPPAIMMLTPNGRFELNTKICISFTNYHEELWQPAWGVRTAIIGLQGFFPLKGTAAVGVGALEYPTAERKRLAALSREWVCPRCKISNLEHLPDPPESNSSSANGDGSSSRPIDTSADEKPANSNPSNAASQPAAASDTPAPSFKTGEVQQPTSPSATAPVPAPASPSAPAFLPAPMPVPEQTVVSRPIQLVAPKPTRPLARAPIVTQLYTPPRTPTASQPTTREGTPQPALAAALRQTTPRRPPIILDTAICVLLVLLLALICRRIL